MKRDLDDRLVTIYTLTSPITGLIFYVGYTTTTLRRRLDCHWTVRAAMNPKYDAVINELRKVNKKPIIEALDTGEYKNKRQLEGFWIQTVSGWGFELVNHRHNANKSYIPHWERKRQRDLRMKVLSEMDYTLIKELYKFGDHTEIAKSTGIDCSDERVRQIISQIINNTKKKMPFWIYDYVFNYYNKRAKKIYDIYSQKLNHDTAINAEPVC